MHNNYYLLRQLTVALDRRLQGAIVAECFSQNKDELIITFDTPRGHFFIKAMLAPEFSCLSFPENFERARRNSVTIFESLQGLRFMGIYQYDNERSFHLDFEHDTKLLFKMHGNRSNALLVRDGKITSLFRTRLRADLALIPSQLDRHIDWSYEHFLEHRHAPREVYFTFGKIVWRYLKDRNFSSLPVEAQWNELLAVRTQLVQGVYYVTMIDGAPFLSLIPYGEIAATLRDPVEALNSFYRSFMQLRAFVAEKKRVLSGLDQQLARLDSWLDGAGHRLEAVRQDDRYRSWADIIMANLDKISAGKSAVILEDFYHDNAPVEIKLNPGLSAQKNAEVYYRKARNQSIEASHLTRLIEDRESQRAAIESARMQASEAKDLNAVRRLSGAPVVSSRKKEGGSLPYIEHQLMGYRILVGRNAQANDQLLQQFTSKDDLWLHARDVSGSHVIVKHQAGKKIPTPVIERAAQLAAFHSKRKNESLCPVIVTPRKYVRKRKGDPAGVVAVDREEVIMVVPAG